MRRLQDEVRVALTKYALVPVVIMALICMTLAGFYWNRNVVRLSADKREQAVQILTETLTDYEDRVESIARADMTKLAGSEKQRQEFYAAFYHELNLRGDYPYFYLLDENRDIILANPLPRQDTIQSPVRRWGALYRMELRPNTLIEFAQDRGTEHWNLLIGRALQKEGRLQGYMVFVLPEELLTRRIASPEVQFVLLEEFGYTPVSTLGLFKDVSFKNLLPELAEESGVVSVQEQSFYMTRQAFWQDKFTLYSFVPIGSRIMQLTTGIFILLGVLLLMLPIILFSLKRETSSKMQAVEELTAAFRAVKQGNLDYKLQIHTGNEFEEIADEYNRMVRSLKELMALNEAEARANVVSEIRQLESQFNPHFLFNTLENIKFMIKLDPAAAGQMVLALSALLRYSINNTIKQVTLRDDLTYLANYLLIQQKRFGRRLDYQAQVAPEALDCLVPKLLLQPVVENAIKYGADAEGQIKVRAQVRLEEGRLGDDSLEPGRLDKGHLDEGRLDKGHLGKGHLDKDLLAKGHLDKGRLDKGHLDKDPLGKSRLWVEITDQGLGIEKEQLEHLQQLLRQGENTSIHTGLYNIHRRIQLMYGTAYGLELECPPHGGTRVRMVLPVCRADKGGETPC